MRACSSFASAASSANLRLAGELAVERRQRLFGSGVDEEGRRVVQELVAGRALDRPVAEPLARLEDLLDPDVLDPRLAEPPEVAGRVGEPVRVVDAEAVDEPVADELEDLPVETSKTSGILDADTAELTDVEEAAADTSDAGSQVEELRPQAGVAPERVLLARGHVVRDDVEDHAESGLAEPAELRLAAELLGDVGRVDDVVAVRRAAPREPSGER